MPEPNLRALFERTSSELRRDIQAARAADDSRRADYLRERRQEIERDLKPLRTGSDPSD